MAEHKWDSAYFYDSFLPDAMQIYLSEIAVDWIKHAFVTKFNNIEAASVYQRFTRILYKDVSTTVKQTPGSQRTTDHCHRVIRRLGFAPFPLGCIVIATLYPIIQRWGAIVSEF
eukprot:gene28631-17831_t